ncbi:hypothetical protein BUALT_Bualt15G0048200 [Buddleja alternifolia]|uniref:Transcriptional adapter 1 n=1 Tax=Buddleja alternifolia TaxID=168488 RepID=A0AAV6WHY9_9LAMI|nr:hypothetical protein BUALT_Bualt15G0048200 [Buddleja alternifolia]
MVANHRFSRVDTLELKDLIYRKIGHHRAEKYLDQLNKFLSLKLSKVDFDKSCLQIIGRENISLHNRFIRSILQNAGQAKVPPQKSEGLKFKIPNGYLKRSYLPSPLGPLGKSYSVTCEEDGEEDERFAGSPGVQSWGPVTAPLGVSVKSGKALRYNHCDNSCQNGGELPDSRSLRGRLEKKLRLEGVGISMDCANLINNSLDVFLKRLIEPCIGIAGSRSVDSRFSGKQSNGQMMSELNVSVLDFRVAMELNPRTLGEAWPIQLEKICHHALDA